MPERLDILNYPFHPRLSLSFFGFANLPANLTQQYLKAEQAYRRATTPQEELDCLQLMFKELPKHKGTDKLQSDLKQKISRAKEDLSKPKKAGTGRGFRLPRQGAGRAVIIGGPNAGKSQLLATLTSARPEIAPYPFTTREPQPGMMPWNDVMVQLIDTPPITADVYDPDVQALIRGADLVLLMLDLGDDEGGAALRDVWNQISKTKTRLGRETGIDEDDVGVTFTRAFLVDNKIDDPEATDRRNSLPNTLRSIWNDSKYRRWREPGSKHFAMRFMRRWMSFAFTRNCRPKKNRIWNRRLRCRAAARCWNWRN